MLLNPGAFYDFLMCIRLLKTGLNSNALSFIVLCLTVSLATKKLKKKNDPKRKSSVAAVSRHFESYFTLTA